MPNSDKEIPQKRTLIRKKIFFDEDAYVVLKETSDNTGDGFSIILNSLILQYLPYGYLHNEGLNNEEDGE